jgi:plastocyanin domain-containing protein
MPIEHPTPARLALLLMLAAPAACDPAKKEQSSPPTTPASGALVRVEANDQGFQPPRVQIPANQPVNLLFRRTSDSTCATSVVFPDLKIERDLPLNKDVQVDLPALPGGKELAFQCGMGMYKSKIVAQ